MHLHCCVEDSWRVPWTSSRSSQSILKEISPEHSLEGWCWSWNSNTLATWSEELTHWKRLWCRERLRAGEGGDRGWDDWMASPTQWTWVWTSSRSWWWTGRPGMLQPMGSQTVGHDWVTELITVRSTFNCPLVWDTPVRHCILIISIPHQHFKGGIITLFDVLKLSLLTWPSSQKDRWNSRRTSWLQSTSSSSTSVSVTSIRRACCNSQIVSKWLFYYAGV